jgi:peptidoglycan/LPS O-acetylase OafA/YrhL
VPIVGPQQAQSTPRSEANSDHSGDGSLLEGSGTAATLRTDGETGRLPSLDGLRALSIGLVVIGHALATMPKMPPWLFRAIATLGNAGLGVSFFFVISGYLITHLLLRELSLSGTVSFHNFYIRRVTRIFPAFYCYLSFVSLAAGFRWIKLSAVDVLMAATFTWNYLPFGTGSWWLGQTWSLCIEEQFYLLWPVTLVSLGPKKAAWLAALIILLEPPIRIASYILWPSYRSRIPVMLHTRADLLMFGCLLALMQENVRFRETLVRFTRPAYLAALATFLFIVEPVLTDYLRGGYVLSVGWTLEGASIAMIVFGLMRPFKSVIWSIFNSRPMNWLGKRSYGLYLWQQLFLTRKNATIAGLFPINIIAALIMSAASFRFIEEPVMRERARFLSPVSKLPVTAN